MDDQERMLWAVAFVFISLLGGLFVYVWMVNAGLPTILAGPIGVIAFFVIVAALFGIGDVVIEAIRDLFG